MAFDMYQGEIHECIEHHEEYLLELAYRTPDAFPQLCALYRELYGRPTIMPDRANALVYELIALIDIAQKERKSATAAIVRLLQFFSLAVRTDCQIRGVGD